MRRLLDRVPHPHRVRSELEVFGAGPPHEGRREALERDLARGEVGSELARIMEAAGVGPTHARAFFGVLADLRAAFAALASLPGREAPDRDMQRTGWIHTRLEVLRAARAYERTIAPRGPDHARNLLATLLGSAASDAFKDASRHSLLWHNRAGAELVLPVLVDRHFDLRRPANRQMLELAMRLALEHQITPPGFMAQALRAHLSETGGDEAVVEGICAKVANPLDAPQQQGEILFSSAELAVLERAHLPGWATMTPGRAHDELSQIVVLADVLQYVHHDGLLKIAVDIRDPEQQIPIMRDGLICEAVRSAVKSSFEMGLGVVRTPALIDFAKCRQDAMLEELEREIWPEVKRRLAEARGDVSALCYWGRPAVPGGPVSVSERRDIDLVKQTFRDVVAERGAICLDPFSGACR